MQIEEVADSVSGHHRQSVGLLGVGGELGDQPVRADADRGGEVYGLPDRRLRPPADVAGRTHEALQALDVKIGLVDGYLLDDGGKDLQSRHDLPRDPRIAFHTRGIGRACLTVKDLDAIDLDALFRHSNGSAVPVEYTSTPIRQDGRLQGAVVVFRDISERREMERQREAAYEEIKRLKEQLELERDYLREEIKVYSDFAEIVGGSLALKRTLAQIEAVAATPASVLVLGESGVAKEMIARAIPETPPLVRQHP